MAQEMPAEEAVSEEVLAAPESIWDDLLDRCVGLARAAGAMLIDALGQVVTARGDWPEPGVEAIAARLVPAMDRALKDAPTRSVSVPLAGRHLTAWRVPVGDGLLTVGFVADAPLKADVRPGIDAEIHSTAGA
jgi:hypothetical protein